MGLNWRTSTEAQKGSSGQFGDILSFGLYGRAVGCQKKKDFFLNIKKKSGLHLSQSIYLKIWPTWVRLGTTTLHNNKEVAQRRSLCNTITPYKSPYFPGRKTPAAVCVHEYMRASVLSRRRADPRRQIHIHNGGHISPAI